MLGIIIGVGGVITMVAVGSGAQARVAEQIQSLGAPTSRGGAQVVYGNLNWATSFTQEEVDGAAKVVLIGQTVAANLFGDSDPLNQVIRIRNVPFGVIGVPERKGQTTYGLTLLLAAIASVSLLVGGIGIMNIMLVSVTERTREIGLRMAVGARGRDILVQFLVEAVTLSLIGGAIGIALGLGGSYAIAYFARWRTIVHTEAVGVAFFFAAAVGIFFGFYPARKASRLNPIDALRYE